MSRRRANTNELVTIYWRDIPAQVTATCNGKKGSWLLGERFQVAIDRAATVAGLTSTDDYVQQWRSVRQPCAGDPQAAAEAAAERLIAAHDNGSLQRLVDRGGLAAEPTDQTETGTLGVRPETSRPVEPERERQ